MVMGKRRRRCPNGLRADEAVGWQVWAFGEYGWQPATAPYLDLKQLRAVRRERGLFGSGTYQLRRVIVRLSQ